MTAGAVRTILAAVLGALGLGALAAPAWAQEGHSLALSGPGTATIGQPTTLQATGTVPDDVFLNRYLNVYAIPTSVVPSCPATFQNAIDLSYNSSAQGGDTVTSTVPAEGNFTIPVAYTPTHRGRFLLCGYLHEGVETMASAQHIVGVSAPGSAKPRNVTPPRVKQSRRALTCNRGKWSGAPTRYAYRWQVAGEPATGAKRRTLRITGSMRGRKVACVVTARNSAGATKKSSRAVRVRRLG